MKQKRIILLVMLLFLILIIGYFIYINMFYFKGVSDNKYEANNKVETSKEDRHIKDSNHKGPENNLKREQEDVKILSDKKDDLQREIKSCYSGKIDDKANNEEKTENIKRDKIDNNRDDFNELTIQQKSIDDSNKAREKNIDSNIIEEKLPAKEHKNETETLTKKTIETKEDVVIIEPVKDDLEEIKAQIDEKDRQEGEKIASKIDVGLINEYLEDGLTEDEKKKIDSHLRQCLSPSEYEKAKELVYKYLHLLNE